jgi:predicted porin
MRRAFKKLKKLNQIMTGDEVMKRSLFAFSALSVCAGVAHAQSSVTLYGIIDEALVYQSNARTAAATATAPAMGGRKVFLDSGAGQSGSRWGLRGIEDLGGGLSVLFVLESGINLNTGAANQGGLEFGRQAFVGLSSQYGTVTMGRQYDSVVTYFGPLIAADQFSGGVGAQAGDINNANNGQRVNNAIKYASPSYNGLTFGGLYSLGGVAGATGRNQVFSLGAAYSGGPLVLGAAYLKAHQPNTSFFSNSALSSGTLAAGGSSINGTNTIFGGYATADTYQVAAVGGIYSIGKASIGLNYSNVQFQGLQSGLSGVTISATGPQGNAIFNIAEANFVWHFTPVWQVAAAYTFTNGSTVRNSAGVLLGNAKYNEITLATDYALSKRTDVYLEGLYQRASGTDSTGQPAKAMMANVTPSSNNHQVLVRLAIRQRF